jgi:ketosteroid isomerase-like protein
VSVISGSTNRFATSTNCRRKNARTVPAFYSNDVMSVVVGATELKGDQADFRGYRCWWIEKQFA